jgi:putative NADPH-quinone reductase
MGIMHRSTVREEAAVRTNARMTHVTLLTAHPVKDSLCNQLAEAWKRGAGTSGATVHHFDATELDFDLVLRGRHVSVKTDEPDLARVRAAVEASAHVTWLFPTWWVGPPAAMKGLVDRLLLPKWAFLYEGKGLPQGLLAGRSARFVTTMDSPRPWYWLMHRTAHEGAFVNGTLKYCGFSPVKGTTIYSARTLDEAGRAKWMKRLEREGAEDALRAGVVGERALTAG